MFDFLSVHREVCFSKNIETLMGLYIYHLLHQGKCLIHLHDAIGMSLSKGTPNKKERCGFVVYTNWKVTSLPWADGFGLTDIVYSCETQPAQKPEVAPFPSMGFPERSWIRSFTAWFNQLCPLHEERRLRPGCLRKVVKLLVTPRSTPHLYIIHWV